VILEPRHKPLLPVRHFAWRQLLFTAAACCVIALSLGLGVLGYHELEGLGWLDSLLNASMILGGMGPVDAVRTDGGKLFASLYALFSGVVFLVAVGVLVTPIAHRIFHKFHLESGTKDRS
jgi:hypothetical protein